MTGQPKHGSRISFSERIDTHSNHLAELLALALGVPIWTFDKNFLRIRERRVVGSDRILSGELV